MKKHAPFSRRALCSIAASGLLLSTLHAQAISPDTEPAIDIAATTSKHRNTTPMPVLMWGIMPSEAARSIGFTAVESSASDLDEIQKYHLDGILRSSKSQATNTRYAAVDRQGNPYPSGRRGAAAGQIPQVQGNAFQRARDLSRAVGNHASWRYVLLHPERRGHTEMSFDPISRQAFRAYAGFDIPEEVISHRGLDYRQLLDFPVNRILPENDPRFRFYQWYWESGDGWAAVHSASARGIRESGRNDIITIASPALRIPSVYDSWGEVQALLHWTYTHPDPTRLAHTTDAMLTMAAGSNPPKQTFAMTQLFTKRHYVMPRHQRNEPSWDSQATPFADADPDSAYLTISPDQLKIAFWSTIARPIDAIGFHGWQSIIPSDGTYKYKLTHLQTQHTLKALLHDVIKPLGPTLLKLQDPPAKIGFLQSFASEMFAGRGTYGWPFLTWQSDAYLALLHAGLQPRVLFDQTIRQGGLDDLDILVLVHCDVLTDRVADAIAEFQRRGGRVIGDEYLAPGVTADILWETHAVDTDAARRKQTILTKSEELEKKLGNSFPRQASSSHRDVLVRLRQAGAADYLFAVNDQRQAGTYLGQHGWVLEEGLPTVTELSVRRESGTVYDLLERRPVPTVQASNGWLRFDHAFGPGEGALFMITPTAIDHLTLTLPPTPAPGKEKALIARILDRQGHPVNATIPVQVQLYDQHGNSLAIDEYRAAEHGELHIPWPEIAENHQDRWEIQVTELASGQTARTRISHVESTDRQTSRAESAQPLVPNLIP